MLSISAELTSNLTYIIWLTLVDSDSDSWVPSVERVECAFKHQAGRAVPVVSRATRASMADRKQTKEICTVLFLCILWYAISSTNNVVGKTVLNDFPYPMTMTMVQLLSITIFSGPMFNLWGVRKYADISWNYYVRLIIPLAFGKFVASVFSHVSIWKVPVSYAHTG